MTDGGGAPVLSSLIREDLLSAPGPVLAAAAAVSPGVDPAQTQLTGCLAALAAGEPRRALALLEPSHLGPRVSAALTAWAVQLDGNWYPGDVGAETLLDTARAFVQALPGSPDEEFLEQLVSHGPLSLVTPRTLIETSMRLGTIEAVRQAASVAVVNLDGLAAFANARGLVDIDGWTWLARADIAWRAGMAEADPLLAAVRSHFSALGDAGRVALTWMVEGDWHAAPGSSPESLGLDLAPQQSPSPLPPRDLARADACYGEAEALASGVAAPRMDAALALRRGFLARVANDAAAQRAGVDAAVVAYAAAGDGAGYHLATTHRLVADIDEGALGGHLVDLGGGWHRPDHGPIAETLAWAESVGSRSWCAGLGRLLQRCAEQWDTRRSAARSRVGFLAALPLIAADPGVPSQSLVTAVANADVRSDLAGNALLRLERAFGPALDAPLGDDMFAFPQQLEAALLLLSTTRARSRGSGGFLAADRMDLLSRQLTRKSDAVRETLPPADREVPSTIAELQDQLVAMRGGGSLEEQAASAQAGVTQMIQMMVIIARQHIATTDVLAPMTRAEAFERAGQTAEASRWFDTAVEAARRPEAEPHLLALALISARRLDEARAALSERAAVTPDEFQLPLWMRIGDHGHASAALDRLERAGRPPTDWHDLLSVAELRLARGQPDEARRTAEAAIQTFEDSVRLLVRDPERLDACDQPDVAALYTTLAKTYLPPDPVGPEPSSEEADASFEAAELARALSSDTAAGAVSAPTRQAWSRTAAEYAAAAGRLLATLASTTPEQQASAFAGLDQLDAALMTAEHSVEAEDPGILLRRAVPAGLPSAADLRRRLPAGTLLLEYLAVGDDLLAWALTSEAVRPMWRRVRLRDLAQLVRVMHTACADGRAPETELAGLLIEPFADLLRGHERVVVVPFGPLSLVPFHALRLDGAPLGLTHTVSYAHRAAGLPEQADDHDRPVPATRALVVGDPAFDPAAQPSLRRLPGSAAEAQAVAAVLHVPDADVLLGLAATEAAVQARIEQSDLVHVSSHGHLDEFSPFASALVLAGSDELTVADIAGLAFGTDLAVLTGCDTGRGNATLGGDLVGLTRSLLRSGVERAVVSLWPVDDWVAPVVMSRFYTGLSSGSSPAHALTEAQRAIYAMSADELRAGYAALGGDADADGNTRRGRDLDPDLRDEDDLPEPLGGDAERYWAPFVLVD